METQTNSSISSSSSEEFLQILSTNPTIPPSYYHSQNITSTSSFFTTPQNHTLFTRSWLPLSSPPKALVFLLHGYGNDTGWTFQSTPIHLAQKNYACFAPDLPSHGRSSGLPAFVPNISSLIHDCVSYFSSIRSLPEFANLKVFLFGESMGGAICLLIHLTVPSFPFDGAILIAPMCKISDRIKPRWPVPEVLGFVARFMPTLPIVPTEDLVEKSVKVERKRAVAMGNPVRYKGKPRLGTVVELLRVTEDLGRRLEEVEVPFIVLHGSEDAVTDPEVSLELYRKAKSVDKTMRIYEGMMHSLLFGETDENVEVVRKDIVDWLDHRCSDK